MPGSRWDGVDRSNGFEKRYYESIAKKKAIQEEAYKWSTEDMWANIYIYSCVDTLNINIFLYLYIFIKSYNTNINNNF